MVRQISLFPELESFRYRENVIIETEAAALERYGNTVFHHWINCDIRLRSVRFQKIFH